MGIENNVSEEYIKTEREIFRARATDALRLFTPVDRENSANLETKHTTTDSVL